MSEASPKMFTEQHLGELSRRRIRVLLPTILFGVAAMLLYLLCVAQLRDATQLAIKGRFGDGAARVAPFGLILVAFGLFLVPICIAEKYAKRFQCYCPLCGHLLSRIAAVLATKRCPACERQIVAGNRARSYATYKRLQAWRTRQFLAIWLWAWPASGLLGLVWWYFCPEEAINCGAFWAVPLIGTATSGWAWLRTFERRYVPQLTANIALLGTLGAISWSAW
jgi:hypothetical protein